jgi:DNA polymerase-3 subunit alpha
MEYIPNFIARKHGREPIKYDLPEMEEYLKDTYGITVYQEQVMLLSQKLGGFSKGDADVLRKAMGKKQIATLNKMKLQFIEGAQAKGHPKDKLEKIWTDWEAFAQYAFNKSHSTCYAFIAYQTAYLKAHYPSEYMAAVLNNAGSIDKITFFMEECKKMGLVVLGPDINESQNGFAVNNKGEIRFGFSGMKGVGEAAIDNIIAERNKNGLFKDVFDLVKRVNLRSVGKRSLESLIYSGAFDEFKEMHRAQYFVQNTGEISSLEKILKFGSVFQSQVSSSSNTLFGEMQMPEIVPPKLPNCDLWPLIQKLDFEKEVTGMFISGHPLDNFKFELQHYGIIPLSEYNQVKVAINERPSSRQFRLAGLVVDAQHRLTKNGKKFGVLHLEDFSSKSEFTLWSEDYVKFQNYLSPGQILLIEGGFKERFNSGSFEFKIFKLHLLDTIKTSLTKQISLDVEPQNIDENFINFFDDNMKKYPGNTSLKFNIIDHSVQKKLPLSTLGTGFSVNDEMIEFLTAKSNYVGITVVTHQ